MSKTFAQILLPQKIGQLQTTLTYAVPLNLEQNLTLGKIVEVPLRKSKQRGVVMKLHRIQPSYPTKKILQIVEGAPHLQTWQIELLEWIADYYFCPLYKVLKLFLPTAITSKKKLPKTYGAQREEDTTVKKTLTLSPHQIAAIQEINQSPKPVTLLHGITGSGKTEIYRRLAEEQVKAGKQVLILVPEISLTPQTLQTFEEEFGEKIAVIHSQLTLKQKEKHWYDIFHGTSKIVIGSRSALFAPFANLGLIIMDEEHEPSYKQDQAPRYHAKEIAIKTAELLNIRLILGSATPSLESYFQAKQGNYNLVKLTQRVSKSTSFHSVPAESTLPKVTIIDLREELRKNNYSSISELLNKKLDQTLARQEQSILFLNRRGAASAVLCRECGYVVKCKKCEIAMTLHRKLSIENTVLNSERLICHHCGAIEKVPVVCPKCQSVYIRYIGIGTQKVEAELQKIFPLARILRADRDTVHKRDQFKAIYQAIKNHEADILIGTQMIAMGLHLPKVNVVGIILAELSLTLPDLRSSERTFQLLTQVAGRAGRECTCGEVVIQTYLPKNYVIQHAAKHDYEGFYKEELALREKFNYPPFTKLLKITISETKGGTAVTKATKIFQELEELRSNIKAPEAVNNLTIYPAFMAKLKGKYRWNILISGQNPSLLLKSYFQKIGGPIPEVTNVKIDVDPISTL